MLAWRRNIVQPPTQLVFAEYISQTQQEDDWSGRVKAITDPVILKLEAIEKKNDDTIAKNTEKMAEMENKYDQIYDMIKAQKQEN